MWFDVEPHDVPATALMAEPVPASKAADSVPATQFHHLSDEMLPSPLKKISPRHLQDGEVYRGEAQTLLYTKAIVISLIYGRGRFELVYEVMLMQIFVGFFRW